MTASLPEPAKSAQEEKEQHIASLRFHQCLAEFAENRLLGFVIAFMARSLTDLTVYRRLYDPPNHELAMKGREHQQRLVKALRQGDADAAREIMASHMTVAEELMAVQEAELERRFISVDR